MRSKDGFTIVELLVVLAIMLILFGLGVAGVSMIQVSGRNEERRTDVENIVRQLELNYTNGAPTIPSSQGSYLGTSSNGLGNQGNYPYIFGDTDLASLRAPGVATPNWSLRMATSTGDQTPGDNDYIYQPFTDTGSLCTTVADCRKFTLWYKIEGGAIEKIESKRQ